MIAGSQWLFCGEVWSLKKMCSILVDVENVRRAFNCMIYCGVRVIGGLGQHGTTFAI